ncbi:MAG: tail fiber domain-containing protein, partial [Candidatus Sulfotelmatobacter sp.]
LNLLYASGVAAPAQILSINSKGVLTFAPGQIFPIPGAGVTNAMLAHSSLTVTAGTALTGGGVVSLGGATTLNVDLTKVPLLTVSNTFTGNQAVNGNLAATGVVAASSFEIGSNLFGFGNYAAASAYTGFAGNASTPGIANTGNGVGALSKNTGIWNTAVGAFALGSVTSGGGNTAVGHTAGFPADNSAVTGNYNTFLGSGTQLSTGTLTNATAIGANSQVNESNALVLGSIPGVNGATVSPNVGIGTAAPNAKLTISGPESTTNGFGAAIKLSNSASGGANYYFRVGATGTETSAGGLSIANDDEYIMTLTTPGYVGIQTQNPTNIFTIVQGGGSALADGWATYSSRRWKTNIHPLSGALAKIERLQGVSYDLKATGKHEIGVIAEEVGKVVPEVVTYEDNGKDARGVDYSRLTALLIEAVKQQQKQISVQTRQIARQERQIRHELRMVSAQQHEIARLNHKVGALEVSVQEGSEQTPSLLSSAKR